MKSRSTLPPTLALCALVAALVGGASADDPPKTERVPIPARDALFGCRTGDAKAALLRTGATAESEKAVARGLAWLHRQQTSNGTWAFDDGAFKEHRAAATGLALLAFLGAGESHKPPAGKDAFYTKVVKNGLEALKRMCPKDGKDAGRISTNTFAQALATHALCDAYGLTRDAELKPYAQAAVDCLQKAQGPNGSWGDTANEDGDTALTGWPLQALYVAQLSDLKVDAAVLKKAVAFLDRVADGKLKSAYGSTERAEAQPGTVPTAIGLLSRYCFDDWKPDHAGLIDGATGLMKRPPVPGGVRNLYYYAHATQVLRNFGGQLWNDWNEVKVEGGATKDGVRDWLVKQQSRKEGASMWSWDPEGGWIGTNCGRLGTTAMCVLTLEVYYRHYPLYMQDAKGKMVKITEQK